MKRKKIITDIAMTVLLLLLMAYELIGSRAHEWFGTGMLIMFILHHILNRKWTASIRKGRYTPFRILQTLLVLLILASILCSIVTGIMMSRYIFDFLPGTGGMGQARILHMLAAYWGFVWMSLHLGLHWNRMIGMVQKERKNTGYAKVWILRIIGAGIAAYGVYAFVIRGIGSYMFLHSLFVFFDYEEPLLLFYADYIAVMGLFVWIGHYLAKWLGTIPGKKTRKRQDRPDEEEQEDR